MHRTRSSIITIMCLASATCAVSFLFAPNTAAVPRVEVCHIPSDNPNNFHTINRRGNALSAHLSHGDLEAPCSEFCESLCDDSDVCTIDSCNQKEQCIHVPVDCSDGNSCTEDLLCDPVEGCRNEVQLGQACDDGDACTAPDSCSSEADCVGSGVNGCCLSVADCNDSQNCTTDSCDFAAGAPMGFCRHEPVACTDSDLCVVGACNETAAVCEFIPVLCETTHVCSPYSGSCEPACEPCLALGDPELDCDAIDDGEHNGSCVLCGNDRIDVGEDCDAANDAACHTFCQSDCTCPPLMVLAEPITVGTEGTTIANAAGGFIVTVPPGTFYQTVSGKVLDANSAEISGVTVSGTLGTNTAMSRGGESGSYVLVANDDARVRPEGIAADSSGNVYVALRSSNNVFRITPLGAITQIIDATGDGDGNLLDNPRAIAVDPNGNIYVVGEDSFNVFKVTPGGVITEIVDHRTPGVGDVLGFFDRKIAADSSGNVYVSGRNTDNAFKIAPDGSITEVIDATGDGAGNILLRPASITTDSTGNVYVAGSFSDNVFKITPAGSITEIIDATGDGLGNILARPLDIAVDSGGNVYVTGIISENAFRITPAGVITRIIDATGDGVGNELFEPKGIAVDSGGNVYVAQNTLESNVFKIAPDGAIKKVLDATGDGGGNVLALPTSLAVDLNQNVYVAGALSNNVFKVTAGGEITEIIDSNQP
jgi:hypothetical protein